MNAPVSTDERSQALALANRLLDEPNCDPDDDLRVLSRWLIRRHETADNHRATLIGIADMDPATEAERMLLWAKDALSGYTETAEVSQKKQQDEINRLRGVIKEAAARKLDTPNGIWSMEHNWSLLKSDLLTALEQTR